MSIADKLWDLHDRTDDEAVLATFHALPEIAAVIEAAEKIDPAESRHWNRSDSYALSNALAALARRLEQT